MDGYKELSLYHGNYALFMHCVINLVILQYVSIYAAYLYDSVMLYAKSLDLVIREDVTDKNETLTYEKLMKIVTNGTRIVDTMTKKNSPYKSKSL